ncbi:TetR/AcrR family transcriptional regulator [Sphingobium fontiphilum]|nr:TetR/AcrR family transcriptional regulator [Sphingobium fontiphilum]
MNCSSSSCGSTASRREARRQQRRDEIVRIASRTFLDQGYAATSMSAVAAELGGSKGTLWSYFPSKEALFAAVLDQATGVLQGQIMRLFNPCADIEATLRNVCRALLVRIASPEAIALHRLIVGEAGRFPEIGRIFYERAPGRMKLLLADYLVKAMDRGVLRRDDPLFAARCLVSLCQANDYQQVLVGIIHGMTDEQIEADTSFAVATFLRAYAPTAEVAQHG